MNERPDHEEQPPSQRDTQEAHLPISAPVFTLLSRQEQRNAEQIENLRQYFLSKIDALQDLVGRHVSREELARELGHMHDEVANIRVDVRGQIEGVRLDVTKVITRLDSMEGAILGRQKESYQRIIRIQAALLSPVFLAIIIYVLQIILHNVLPH